MCCHKKEYNSPNRNECIYVSRDIYEDAHNSLICNLKLETTKMSINSIMNFKMVANWYSETLHSNSNV